jgi:hypothetical protein
LSSRTTELRLLTLAGCAAALVPRLAHRGMFLDGVTYASIARNMAEGRGHFWEPFYTATIYPAFHEHPPLAFWLQSIWFRVLGDRLFVERLYCLAAAAIIAAFIVITWRAAYGNQRERADQEWLAIAFWMLVPVVSWSIVGNLLETTVSVFTTAAVAALIVRPDATPATALARGCISGLAVLGAVMSKGPVGFFPLASPVVIAWLLPDRRRSSLWSAVGQWTTLAVCVALLLAMPAARESLTRYFDVQLVTSLAGQREVSGSSFAIVVELLQGVCLPMAIMTGIVVFLAGAWVAPRERDRGIAIAFTLIGLSGTLPMLVSPKQTGHYLMPAVPFYAIGAAAFVAETAAALERRLSTGGATLALRILSGFVAAGAVIAIWIPAVERDPVRLADLDRLAATAPRGQTVGLCPRANSDWLLHAWMQRRFVISLDAAAPAAHEWFLMSTTAGPDCPPAACVPMSQPERLTLMRCR